MMGSGYLSQNTSSIWLWRFPSKARYYLLFGRTWETSQRAHAGWALDQWSCREGYLHGLHSLNLKKKPQKPLNFPSKEQLTSLLTERWITLLRCYEKDFGSSSQNCTREWRKQASNNPWQHSPVRFLHRMISLIKTHCLGSNCTVTKGLWAGNAQDKKRSSCPGNKVE